MGSTLGSGKTLTQKGLRVGRTKERQGPSQIKQGRPPEYRERWVKRKESKEGGGGEVGSHFVPVRVPLNKLECKNTEEGELENRRWSEHPPPGPTRSSVHNYNTEMSRRRARRAWAPNQELGKTGRD